ncbi:MAG: CRISPR-associated HD domain-containing protein [Candidatus Aramenus sulfurataquae]|uniref:CRISPR-associated HD domain-containing protein n=2 Tax=Candidatus Aramenus sulfurataquae TaxID=1326980 RepID=W7KUV7_9CREN|nr:MAG: CRISPR-associated HD domain-containing protein [Candidatus Aramenus sulfurataquae]
MKPCAFDKQELLSHALGSVEMMKKAFDDNYFEVVSKRLNKAVGLNVTKEDVKNLVTFLTAFHDLGKAAEYYQSQFDENCNAVRNNTSFMFHELGGALFLWYNDWENQTLKVMSTLTVLNHLNAIRNFNTIRHKTSEVKGDHLKLKRYGGGLVMKLLSNEISNPFMKTYNVRDYTRKDLEDMFDLIARYAFSSRLNLKLYVLLLTPVIVGDNLDSTTSREKDESYASKSHFISSLLKEVETP